MKKLLLLLLVAVSLISCTADDAELRRGAGLEHNTFMLSSEEELSLVAIRINDSEGNTIESYEYQNVNNLSLNIYLGEEIMVHVVDEDEFIYDYTMYNVDGTTQLQGQEERAFSHTLIRSYYLQNQ